MDGVTACGTEEFPYQACRRRGLCLRVFCELSRKHQRGKWIMAGIPLGGYCNSPIER